VNASVAPHRISQSDIARTLGLSKNAVSLALSGNPGVSDETREAVRKTAQELGYRRKLRNSRSSGQLQTVALVFNEGLLHFPETMFFGPVIQHLQKELQRRQYNLMVFGISDEDESALRLPPWPAGTVQGILVLSRFGPEFVAALQTKAPVVWIDHYDETLACDKVLTENRLGAFLAVDYLAKIGHREIGFFGGVGLSPSYVERLSGYRAALERNHLRVESSWEWTVADVDPDKILAYWKGLTHRPSAWFCVNDVLAVNLLRVLQEHGVAVPQETAVLGFDDLQLARTTNPEVSSMHVHLPYYATRVGAVLSARLDDPTRPIEVVRIMPTLVARGSTARETRIESETRFKA